MPEDRFWESTPRSLKPYVTAFNIRRKNEDERDWIAGMYVAHAIGSTMSKSGKYPDKALLADVAVNERDAERIKQQKVELLFAQLNAMQANFEINKKSKHLAD